MKKYIKTKDGVYDANLSFYLGNTDSGDKAVIATDGKVGVIISEADSIEELCDYWMYRNALNDYIIKPVNGGGSTKESLARSLKSGMVSEVKLGILTDKGLLYVAEMNKKGNVEFL